jgi:IMP dehydrogenase/GMP reductase
MGGLQAKDDGATRAAASRIVLDRSLPRRRRLRQRWAPKERRRFFCPARSFGGLHLGKTPMHIEHELKLDFKDVLIRPKRSTLTSRSDVDISRQFSFRHGKDSHDGIPIIAANMDSTGTFEMARALAPLGLSVALHKHYAVDEYVAFFRGLQRKSAAFYSIGMTRADEEKFGQVMQAAGDHIGYVCLDVANGYHENFATFVARIRAAWPRLVIMAGNVVTGEMTEQLILSGADFVMLGGMFAGHDESGGERIERDGQLYRRFYGMSSKAAMDKYSGGVAGYRAAEGKEVLLPERGPVEPTVNEILGGVRSACTYVGARRLKELTKRTTFIRVTQQLNEVFGKS